MNGKSFWAVAIGAVIAVSGAFTSTVDAGTVSAGRGKIDCADKSTWPQGKSASRIERMCKKKEERSARSAERLERRKAWKQEHAKSKDMQKVFEANRMIIPREENLGSQIIWMYRSKGNRDLLAQCKEYVFRSSGKLKSRRVYRCN